MKHVRAIFVTLGISFLSFCFYFAYEWKASANEVKKICNQITIGSSLEAVEKIVSESRFVKMNGTFESNGKVLSLLHSTSNFGRHVCFIEYKENNVIETEYHYAS